MAKTNVVVSSLWLEVLSSPAKLCLDRKWSERYFQQLAEIITATYSSAVGSVRQQIWAAAAQLELNYGRRLG